MQPDSTTRILLALILLCLVILIVQGFAGAGDPNERGGARYSVIGVRAGAPLLIRTDGATGEVWKLELRGGDDRWVAFQEPGTQGPPQTGRESKTEAAADAEAVEPPGAPAPDAPSTLESDVPVFAEALVNEALPTDMRVWVADQLAGVDAPSATEALLQGLATQDVEVLVVVLDALEGRDDPRVRSAAEKAASHAEPRVRSAAQRVLDSFDY